MSILKPLRLCILFSRLSGYMAACLKTLKERHGVELLVVRHPPAPEAPFEVRHFEWVDELHDRTKLNQNELQAVVDRFNPDALFMAGWFDPAYLQVARVLRKRGIPVIAGSDAQWDGALRQQIGRVIAPWYLRSAIDVLWVAGERQRQFARRLGFTGSRCWDGYYSGDWTRFARVYAHPDSERAKAFLYVGRYVARKGLDVLVDAYELYREKVEQPWPLICAGAGDEKTLLIGKPGITDKGFVQPDELPELFGHVSAFILPSRKEPWGVVIHEAAAAGLPLICSDACGAAVHLLKDGFNGWVFESGNPRHLAQGMMRISHMGADQWAAMSENSHLLSKQYTPIRWADTLAVGIAEYQQTWKN